jgi:predicted PurR-regulated permease PerM
LQAKEDQQQKLFAARTARHTAFGRTDNEHDWGSGDLRRPAVRSAANCIARSREGSETSRSNGMSDISDSRKPFEYGKLTGLAYLVLILCALTWAKEFLLPIVLAIMISFLLAPVVSRLERWGLHPVLAVLSVATFAFALLGVLLATMSMESLDLVNSLPKYRDNIHAKWAAIQKGPPGPLNLALRNIGALTEDLGKVKPPPGSPQQLEPTKVQIVSGADSALELVKNSVAPILGPTAEFAVIVVLVVFLLLERKRFRDRFLRLIGHSRLATTTLAVDEAGFRISSFLLGQLLVNGAYALVLGIGLSLIGIPNAFLWSVLTLVLRFLPYVGLWISAFFPLVLSVAISSTWKEPILTLSLYCFLEVFTNNVVEPIVLGGSAGMSPLAVIVSALFWTWLWGPVGLLLSTPLTASLVSLGRYFPAFHIFSVLLAADPPTPLETKLIRLLIENRLSEAKALIHEEGGMELTIEIAEEMILPAVRAIENDLFPGTTAHQKKTHIYEQLRELIEELTVSPPADAAHQLDLDAPSPDKPEIVIVPFLGEGDEVVGRILARLLESEAIGVNLLSWRTLRAEKVQRLKELGARGIVISAIESRSAITVGKMAHSIHQLIPGALIFVGLWSLPREGASRSVRKIKESSGSIVYTDLNEAVRGIASLISAAEKEPQAALEAE